MRRSFLLGDSAVGLRKTPNGVYHYETLRHGPREIETPTVRWLMAAGRYRVR